MQLVDPKTGGTALWTADPTVVHNYSTTTASGGQTITLSRATYKLNKDQATALSTLLGSIKATVMETKVDGDSIIVTTTPEAQQAIGQIVRLVQGQTGGGNFQFKFNMTPTPVTPVTPPAAPAKPMKPAKPGEPTKPAAVNLNEIQLHLDNLKDLGIELKLDALKEIEKLKELKDVKDIRIDLEKLKQGEKLKELENNLKDLKEVEKLKEKLKLLGPTDKPKPDNNKKPDEPAM
jgi:hypothetical protein